MFLALRFLLSDACTNSINQHTTYPHAHWFSHQRRNIHTFRPMRFPDTLPRIDDHFHLLEADFLDLQPENTAGVRLTLPPADEIPNINGHSSPKSKLLRSYSHIVTLFFIDTSPNILSALSQIHSLLKPGGIWINLGPLLWTSGGGTTMELSLEEVLRLIEMTGFRLRVLDNSSHDIVVSKTKRVDCEYTADKEAMMKWIYEARFWIAEKI